jgi:CRISPR-associated protein Csx1
LVPIFIFKFFVSPEEIKKFIDKVIETFKEKIFLNKVNGATEIVHQIDIKSSFISILQTYLICFLIEKILGNNIVHEEIELSKLKKIKGDFNWNRVYKMRLEKEFSKLTKVNLDNNFKKYSDLQNDKDKNDENKNKEKLDERNFFAHCGFNYELLSIKKISDEIFLKINDDLIKDAKDLLDKNLPRGDYDGSK